MAVTAVVLDTRDSKSICLRESLEELTVILRQIYMLTGINRKSTH